MRRQPPARPSASGQSRVRTQTLWFPAAGIITVVLASETGTPRPWAIRIRRAHRFDEPGLDLPAAGIRELFRLDQQRRCGRGHGERGGEQQGLEKESHHEPGRHALESPAVPPTGSKKRDSPEGFASTRWKWWAGLDSNQRTQLEQIYSLLE